MAGGKAAARTVDEYIAAFPEETQALLEAVRKVCREAAPGAEERISYQMPALYCEGYLVGFAAWKEHIGLYPAPSGTEAFREELARYASSKGSVRFPIDEPLPLELIERIVRFRLAENARAAEDRKAKVRARRAQLRS